MGDFLKKFLFLAIFFCINAFAEKTAILYIGGDYSSIDYHLGVLSEIERLQIPIDTVVGSDWGNFVGSLWSAGWSSRQIRELVKSWDSLPHAKQIEKSALWQKTWIVKHKEDGSPFLVEMKESKPYFGQILFDLRVQESLWRSDPGSVVPFRQTDSTNNYPFPPPLTTYHLPLATNHLPLATSHLPLATSHLPLATSHYPYPTTVRILSTSTALRDTNGTAEQRHQQKLWSSDSTLIILRPHSKPNPDSLFEAGIQATQTKRQQLSQLTPSPSTNHLPLATSHYPRFLYHPVFDSVPAELQGHLKSFWNPNDTGFLAIRNFLKELQQDGYYRDAKLTLDTSSFLQINTESSPQLSLSLMGFGGSVFGVNAAANLNFRFINQFGYNLNLTAFYGQGMRGVEPSLRLERFFMDNGAFFAKVRAFEYEPTSYFQKNIYRDARLLKENGESWIFGVEKSALQIAVEIEYKKVTSGASAFPNEYIYLDEYVYSDYDFYPDKIPIGFGYEATDVSSMFPYIKWTWQSEDYNRWFAANGFMAELMGGFKAVSVNSTGQNPPLYVSSQGKISLTHPVSKYLSVNGMSEFGFNFRRTNKGKIIVPEELYKQYDYDYFDYFDDFSSFNNSDPALDNRYRFAMGMGSYLEDWQTPDNSSHRYGILSAGISFQQQGSGIFLNGGFVKDGEPNPWTDFRPKKFYTEPKLRIKTDIFDVVLGQNTIFGKNRLNYAKKTENHLFLKVQAEPF